MARIVDKNGIWVTNSGQHVMHDPHSNTRIEPGEDVQVTETKWLANQIENGCIKKVKVEEEKQVEVKAPVKEPAK